MFISFLLIILLKFISFSISESVLLNREDFSSYECGFEHHNNSRVPFSLRYFFLTLIFLLFDLEVVLLLSSPYALLFDSFFSLLVIFMFIVFLFICLIYE